MNSTSRLLLFCFGVVFWTVVAVQRPSRRLHRRRLFHYPLTGTEHGFQPSLTIRDREVVSVLEVKIEPGDLNPRSLTLPTLGIFPSTVLIQTGYQKGEGYAMLHSTKPNKYTSLIYSLYIWSKTVALYLALSMPIISQDSIYYYLQVTS